MPRRGPKPKPTAIKEREGNPGKRPLNKREPKPVARVPSAPAHLKGLAKIEWNRITKKLGNLQILTELDRAALAAYCSSYETYVEADKLCRSKGLTIKTEKGNEIQAPWVGTRNTAMSQMRAFLVEFGMTPSSRTRVSTIDTTPESKLTRYRSGKGD